MKFKQFLPALAAGAIMITTVFGFTTYQKVSANAVTAPAALVQPLTHNFADLDRGKGPQGGEANDQALATALGIDLTKLQAAYQTANTEALKQAVTAGLITQAQADQMATNTNGHFKGLPFVDSRSIDFEALLAQALGIDTTKLQAARAQAFNTSIDAAVTAGTLTQAQADLEKGRYALENNTKFQSSLKTAYEASVKQAVSDGVITQAQADAILKAQASMGARGGFGGSGPKMGSPAGRGGPGGRGGNPGAPNATPAPTITQ